MNRAVFLDRDNTLIVNDGDLGDPQLVKLTQGAASAVASLRGLGYKIVVVSNQGGVARGKFTEQDVQRVHERLAELLKQHANGAVVDRFYFCPFHPEGTVQRYKREHPWRKPQPGMWLQAAEDLKLDLAACWTVGDHLRDMAAGKAAGTRTVLIDGGNAGQALSEGGRPDFTAHNMVEAARVIAQQRRPEPPSASHGDDEPGGADVAPVPGVGSTYPATQPLHTAHRPAPPRPAGRPFKPWAIQPVTEEDAEAGELERSVARATEPMDQLIQQPVVVKTVKVEEADQAEEPLGVVHLSAPRQPAQVTVETHEVDEPPEQDEDEMAQEPGTTQLLTQILRLLKLRQLEHEGDSYYKMVGLGLVQPLALACVVIGITGAGGSGAMFNWLVGAVLLQLVVITLLILHWQK